MKKLKPVVAGAAAVRSAAASRPKLRVLDVAEAAHLGLAAAIEALPDDGKVRARGRAIGRLVRALVDGVPYGGVERTVLFSRGTRAEKAAAVMVFYRGHVPWLSPTPWNPPDYDEDPGRWCETAARAAALLLVHPDGIEAVTSRLAADVLLGTRRLTRPFERAKRAGRAAASVDVTDGVVLGGEIARARRMLEVVASPERKEKEAQG